MRKKLVLLCSLLISCYGSNGVKGGDGKYPDLACKKEIIPRTDIGKIIQENKPIEFSPLIPFKSASSKITNESGEVLDSIFEYLKMGKTKYWVAVYSDKNGPPDKIASLSKERAEAIVSYLENRGIEKNRLIPEGVGSRCYIGSESKSEDQIKNRRVEFLFHP